METTMDPKMFGFNMGILLVFLVSQCLFFILFEENVGREFVVSEFVYEISRLGLEVALFYLSLLFGRTVNIKSAVASNGDLVITGFDENRNEYFSFVIKTDCV
jgi:hypothetical protein